MIKFYISKEEWGRIKRPILKVPSITYKDIVKGALLTGAAAAGVVSLIKWLI